jgi:hypothetical protein
MARHANIAKEMAGLLIAQALDLFLLSQPIATFKRIRKATESLAQGHTKICAQVVSRGDDVTRSGHRKAMCPGFFQRRGHLLRFTLK